MAFNEFLADRIRQILAERNADFFEKRMFGGLVFMVDDKMCLGIVKDEVMARIGLEAYTDALNKPGCSEMNFTGRPMKGYIFLNDDATDLDAELEYWIGLALSFNPFAKATKKKK